MFVLLICDRIRQKRSGHIARCQQTTDVLATRYVHDRRNTLTTGLPHMMMHDHHRTKHNNYHIVVAVAAWPEFGQGAGGGRVRCAQPRTFAIYIHTHTIGLIARMVHIAIVWFVTTSE